MIIHQSYSYTVLRWSAFLSPCSRFLVIAAAARTRTGSVQALLHVVLPGLMLVLAVMLMHTSGESTNRKQSASGPWEWGKLASGATFAGFSLPCALLRHAGMGTPLCQTCVL